MRVHFIAIGGSAMHNLAIALCSKGFEVSGSDDEIFEPSRSRLAKAGILPPDLGWSAERIDRTLGAVILGMHARADNPELLRARELQLPVYSYPEYLYHQSKDKLRVVIGGSHGKTTITAMILHVLKLAGVDCDYMVGAQLNGFDTMVKLTDNARMIILEGDEYLSSPIDRRPKFHLYKADIGLLSGIAWDHINVFPTFENYVEQFHIFIDKIPDRGKLIWNGDDAEIKKLFELNTYNCGQLPYFIPEHAIESGRTSVRFSDGRAMIPINVFGRHNLLNMAGARQVCLELGISEDDFEMHISSFNGASRRLELVDCNNTTAVYKDFAHSPSKLKATTQALREQYPERRLIACMELHTFSSLSASFLEQYNQTMVDADEALVYFNPHTIEHKQLTPITPEQVRDAFGTDNVKVFTESATFRRTLLDKNWKDANCLLMTSGNFDGINFEQLSREIKDSAVNV